MLGFKRQLVFATHSVAVPFSPSSKMSLGSALRLGARTQPRDGRRSAATTRGCSASASCRSTIRPLAIAELDHVIKQESEGGLGAAPAVRRQGARPRRVRSVLGAPREARRAVRAARRRRAAAAQQGVVEQRPPADEGLARRRRERAQQGHRDPARRSGNVPQHDADRRRVRTLSRDCAAPASNSAPAGCRRC